MNESPQRVRVRVEVDSIKIGDRSIEWAQIGGQSGRAKIERLIDEAWRNASDKESIYALISSTTDGIKGISAIAGKKEVDKCQKYLYLAELILMRLMLAIFQGQGVV